MALIGVRTKSNETTVVDLTAKFWIGERFDYEAIIATRITLARLVVALAVGD